MAKKSVAEQKLYCALVNQRGNAITKNGEKILVQIKDYKGRTIEIEADNKHNVTVSILNDSEKVWKVDIKE